MDNLSDNLREWREESEIDEEKERNIYMCIAYVVSLIRGVVLAIGSNVKPVETGRLD